jgi:prepilin-type N-terminal cleavage/methylation domain-containing protein
MFKIKKNKKGFTLVELMVVVVIIGILTAIAIPVYNSVTAKSEEKTCLANQRTIDSAVQVGLANGDKFEDIDTVAKLVSKGYLAVEPKCPSEGTGYTIDATTHLAQTTCAHKLHT